MTPRRLRIVDPCAPRAYCRLGAGMRGLGGTEATVTRIAQGLAASLPVTVEQKARTAPETAAGVTWRPMDLGSTTAPGEVLVAINSWKVALILRAHNPAATIHLWVHNFPGRHNRRMGPALAEAGIGIVCVSHCHARWMRRFLGPDAPAIRAIPNPVDDALRPIPVARDRDLMLFASAPHKGLDQVLAAFAHLRRSLPSLRLEVADPGYLPWPVGDLPEGATTLGRLDHDAVIGKMRRALCLFNPQTRFAETFGLVIAEANAVGCPALLHGPLGANLEVASAAWQCIDAADPAQIEARIRQWRATPPGVSLRPELRLSAVLGEWARLLCGTGVADRTRPPAPAHQEEPVHA